MQTAEPSARQQELYTEHSNKTWPHKAFKAFPPSINKAESPETLISPWSEPITSLQPLHTDRVIFSGEVIGKIGKAVEEGELLKVICIVKDIMQRMSTYPVKIAVTGDSGNGMSSFINALRNIGHEEENSAPTGVVRTTQTPACYSYSNFPSVDLWDLPGTGVTAQSVESYMDEMQFDSYHLIILIASEQFSSNHVKLAKALQGMRKRFYVVWTKLDRDLSTSALPEPQLLQSIQKNIQENLQKAGVKEAPIFKVSNFSPFFHDFPELRHTLQEDIFNIRFRDPLETLSQICDKSIDNKVSSQKDVVFTDQLETTVSLRHDTADLEESLETYQKSFGVDNTSFQQVALSMGSPGMGYRAPMFHELLNRDLILRLMMCFAVNMVLMFLERSWWNGLWNFVIRGFKYLRHRRIIDIVAQDTKTYLRKVLKDCTLPPEIYSGERSGLPLSESQAALGTCFAWSPSVH